MAIVITSATHNGLDGILVSIEVDISKGLPTFSIVGLPDASIKEAKERVRAAIVNSGFTFPLGRITINLAPADVRKIGSLLDLPIAIGILIESKQIENKDLDKFIIFGELSLAGNLKGIKGALPIVFEGNNNNKENFIFPYDNLNEIKHFNLGYLYPFNNLKEVVSFINNNDLMPYDFENMCEADKKEKKAQFDYEEIIGQRTSKRAMEIVASGKHNILLFGSPGSGKTMLAKALSSIMPELDILEEREIAKIYSASGLLSSLSEIERPFRTPHHTITRTALVGGGREIKAGEITLAHNGVLFLDEILEFKREVLEVLREPLEEKVVNINRINGSCILPSNFLLIGAFNPCPCGLYLGGINDETCICSENEKRRYLNRLSRALLDRIDILNFVPRIKYEDIGKKVDKISSANMKERVNLAREIQKNRYKNTKYKYNAEVRGSEVEELFKLSREAKELLRVYYDKYNLTMRGYTKIIKVSRTIADLEASDNIKEHHIFEALGYRKNVNGEIF